MGAGVERLFYFMRGLRNTRDRNIFFYRFVCKNVKLKYWFKTFCAICCIFIFQFAIILMIIFWENVGWKFSLVFLKNMLNRSASDSGDPNSSHRNTDILKTTENRTFLISDFQLAKHTICSVFGTIWPNCSKIGEVTR